MSQSALAYRHSKSAKQRIGKGDRGTTTQAFVESRQTTVNSQPAKQPARNGAGNQRHYHVDATQAENQHDPHCCNYSIHIIPFRHMAALRSEEHTSELQS